jgi:hypothetical protein
MSPSVPPLDRDDLTTWPAAERMAFLLCKCEHCYHDPAMWQDAKNAGRLCFRCAYMTKGHDEDRP